MTPQPPQGGSHAGVRLPHAARLSQGLHPTRDLAHVLRCGARLSGIYSDWRRLVLVSILASRPPGLFGLTPFLSLLGVEPDRVTLMLVDMGLESATNRDG